MIESLEKDAVVTAENAGGSVPAANKKINGAGT
jgi:hypothetical protein